MSFKLLVESLKKATIPPETLRQELSLQIKKCRSYASNARKGVFDYLNAYPCGYQDAHADKVKVMFEKLTVLKLAYAIQSGNSKYCSIALNRMEEL